MTLHDAIIAFFAALAGFDACALWWMYTLDRDRKQWEKNRWPDRTR